MNKFVSARPGDKVSTKQMAGDPELMFQLFSTMVVGSDDADMKHEFTKFIKYQLGTGNEYF